MTECKHGVILYGTKCINCEREKKKKAEEKRERDEALKRILEKAKQLDWQKMKSIKCCPTCFVELVDCYGLHSSGFGFYRACTKCGKGFDKREDDFTKTAVRGRVNK